MNIIPEYFIYTFLERLVTDIRTSIEADTTSDKSENYIHEIFGNVTIGKFNPKREAINLFTTSDDDTKDDDAFKVRIGFSTEGADLNKPLILIMMPNENQTMKEIGEIGESEEFGNTDGFVYSRKSYDSKYSLMIVAMNADRVVMLYRVIQSMFMIYQTELEHYGLINMNIEGADLVQDKATQVPENIFSRVLTLSFIHTISMRNKFYENNSTSMLIKNSAVRIPASISSFIFNYPVNNESFKKNDYQNIAWSVLGDVRSVSLYYKRDISNDWLLIDSDVNECVYTWNIGDIPDEDLGSDYRIKILDNDNENNFLISNNFSIII